MMTEHVHDYVIEGNVWRCRYCPSELRAPDVYIRIKATERLSTEDARAIAQAHEGKTKKILLAYADALERNTLEQGMKEAYPSELVPDADILEDK